MKHAIALAFGLALFANQARAEDDESLPMFQAALYGGYRMGGSLEDAETGEIILVDTSDEDFRKTFKKEAQKESSQLKRMFRKLQIDFVEIVIQSKYDDTIHPLLEYFRKRAAKIR